MLSPLKISCALVVLLLFFSLSFPARAEEPARAGGLSYSLAFTPAYQAETDLDGGGEMEVVRYLFSAGAETALDPKTQLGLSLDYALIDYDFADAVLSRTAPWDQVHRLGVGISLSWHFAGAWSLRVNPLVEFSREEGADWSDAAVYGLVGAVSRRFDTGVTLGLGLGGFSGLEEDQVFPFLLVIWDITENLRLANPLRPGPAGPAGLELAWSRGAWEAGVGGAYRSERFRLDDSGPAPEGIGESEGLPVWLRISHNLGRRALLDLWVGSVYSGELTLEDRDGRRLASTDFDPAPFGALTVSMEF